MADETAATQEPLRITREQQKQPRYIDQQNRYRYNCFAVSIPKRLCNGRFASETATHGTLLYTQKPEVV